MEGNIVTVACRRARTPRTFKGFTLIELLVVIAIIAILAAILFPVFAQAREKARGAACLSNQKQIGTALMMYVQDSDETMPFYFYASDGSGGPSTPVGASPVRYKWMDAIYPYIKSEAVFNCPSDRFPIKAKDGSGQVNNGYHYRGQPGSPPAAKETGTNYGSYLMNATYRYDRGGPGVSRTPPSGVYFNVPLSLAKLVVPSSTIYIADTALDPKSGGIGANFGWNCLTASRPGYPTTAQPNPVINTSVNPPQIDRIVARHQGMTNVIYCDGHARAVSLGSIANPKTSGGTMKPDGTITAFTIEDD